MSKPLELAVFEKEPGRYGGEARYNSPDGFWAYPASHVDGYAQAKRLSDAELAAEYHAQYSKCRDEQWIETLRDEDDYTDTERAAQSTMYEWLSMLHRLATLPHYDEDQP